MRPYRRQVLARAVTHAVVGLDARRVEVEAHVRGSVPALSIVGLADRACQEAKERVRSGIASAERHWPGGRITVNLAPASPQGGSGFDLPIALAILAASGQVSTDRSRCTRRGRARARRRIRPVGGAWPWPRARAPPGSSDALRTAVGGGGGARGHRAGAGAPSRGGGRVPRGRGRTAGVGADGERSRRSRRPTWPTCAGRSGRGGRSSSRPRAGTTCSSPGRRARGRRCSRGGCPGSCPPLANGEVLEVTRIHSVAGLLSADCPVVLARPFRRRTTAPRRPRSSAAGPAAPGEASLAHSGVLLLDELPEFQRPALEALRQPLEDGFVSVARVGGRALFPARFQLVGTMNLCPCGGRGDRGGGCTCSPQRLAAFRDKLSRALLDRFDLVVVVPRARAEELAAGPAEASAPVRAGWRRRGSAWPGRRSGGHARPTRCSTARSSAPALGTRAGARGAGRADGRGARGRRVRPPEHVAEALSYRAPRELGPVSDLAAAVFASEASRPERGLAAFAARFDERAFWAGLEAQGLRFVARSSAAFPAAAAGDPRPAAGALPARRGGGGRAHATGGRSGRSALMLGYGAEVARRLGRELAAAASWS